MKRNAELRRESHLGRFRKQEVTDRELGRMKTVGPTTNGDEEPSVERARS
jgi:hypothetical protein